MSAMLLAAHDRASLPATERLSFSDLRSQFPGYSGLDQMTQHPPLYYAYIAGVLQSVDFWDLRADHALLAARLAGLIFVLPLPFMAWDSVRRLTNSSRAGLLAAASLLAVPQLAHIMGSVSSDSMAIAFSSAVLWLGIRVMTGDHTWRTVFGLGAALALALLSKGTTLPLVAYTAGVLLIWPRTAPIRQRIGRTMAALGTGLLGGWWWVRNLLVYGALQPNSMLYETAPWYEGTGPDFIFFIERVWNGVSKSFWGNFGYLSKPLPSPLTDTLTVLCLAVLVTYAFRRGPRRGPALLLAAFTLALLSAFLVRTWSGYVRTQVPAGTQGRYFFVALIALIALSAIAWRYFIPASARTRVSIALLGAFAVIAVIGIAIEFDAAYDNAREWLLRAPLNTWQISVLGLVTIVSGLTALTLCTKEAIAEGTANEAETPSVADISNTDSQDRSAVS